MTFSLHGPLLVAVQLLSCIQLFSTPWATVCQASLSFTTFQSLLTLMSVESRMPSNHLILCHSLLLLPSIFPSIRVFSNESALCIRWSKFWSFSISPFKEYSGLISFSLFDLLSFQGSLQESSPTPQFKSINSSVLSFFMLPLSHPYMPTGKTIALNIQNFVSKVMSLLYNMLSRLVMAFLPRSKCLLISWLQLPPTVILGCKKIVCHCSIVSPSICHQVMGPDAMIFVF